jgi:hypothetical protein
MPDDPQRRNATGRPSAYVEAHRDLVEGCIDLAITADPVDRRRVNNLEVWASAEALDAWRAEANPPQTGIEPADLQMRRFNAEDGGPLF